MSLSSCKIIDFPKVEDSRGNLLFIEENKHVPFDIKRVFYLCDVPSGATRGGHSNKFTEQVIIALSGSFEVKVDDGLSKKSFFLNRPHYGLYIPPAIWRELENFSSNSVALVLVSTFFDANEYIRDYGVFKKSKEGVK